MKRVVVAPGSWSVTIDGDRRPEDHRPTRGLALLAAIELAAESGGGEVVVLNHQRKATLSITVAANGNAPAE